MPESSIIQTFNPYDLESNLLRLAADSPSFITPIHHIFHINRIEDYIRMVSFPTKPDLLPRKMTVSSFFFLTKGESIRKKGLNAYRFGAGNFFFTPAYEITMHEYISPDAEGFYAHFNLDLLVPDLRLKDLLNDFPFLNFNCYPLVRVEESGWGMIIALLERLEKEYRLGNKCNLDILRIYMIALFTELKQYVGNNQKVDSNAASALTQQYKDALARHIYQKQKVSEYAELLSVTPNHLNKCVRQTLNKSALDLLHDMLLLEAKVLLKQTSLTIGEIAYKVGRNEPTDFARFFKKKMGVSPRAYRSS